MANKKTRKRRKRPNLEANPKRQAHNQLRGYLYQIWHSVNAWLDLADDEILYLEGAEDFDRESGNTVTATQVKDTKHRITLRSREVINAINNYWDLRNKNPERHVKFRLLTRSKIGIEQGNPFGARKPGLQEWSRCSGDEQSIKKISEFLLTEGKISEEVKDFLRQEKTNPQRIYEQLIEPITWETGSKPASFVEQSIKDKLVLHGHRQNIAPSETKKVVDPLIQDAWKVATQKVNRVLTKVRFLEIFEEQTTQNVPTQYLRHLQMQAAGMSNVGSLFPVGSSEISIQTHSSILNTIPPLYPDITPRTKLLTNIQAQLQSENIAVVHGGAGRGKTTLAKLYANEIHGSWFWLDFKACNPSQAVQLLQQLAIVISNQSSPVNIVLDDLNLQPQQLRGYEEILGVVVYRVFERGAKVLITSQHEPPDNLIRHLGVSRSIVVEVLDFTLSEIEQFAKQLGCPADDAKTWAQLVQLHTNGHPRLVHAQLVRLREGGWKQQDIIESLMQRPPEVLKEQEAAQQLLTELPDNHREFLYRLSLMPTGFRKDYVLNIGEIPESIPFAGDIFSQLVGPWIDQVTETYYTISPLLTRAAEQDWSEGKRKELHAQIAYAILKTRNLTRIETQAVLFHSMLGQNKLGFIAVIQALRTAPEDDWKELSQEFSWLINGEAHIPEKFFHGDTFVNHIFRSLQHRIAVEVEPESAPKILERWDEETQPYEPHQLYLQNRLLLATQALRYYQIPLSARRIVGYLEEIINITESNNEAREIYYSSYIAVFEEQKTNESNYFSALFSFCYRAPNPNLCPPFLSDLIDTLDGLQPEIRRILLADFEDDSVDCRLLIDGVWLAESKLDNPNWIGCLEVFDKVIDKTMEWGYLHLAAASARGKAIIYDEYMEKPDAAHDVLQDIVSKVGALPVVEEEKANVYFGQKRYNDAIHIYERILPDWNPSSEQLCIGPLAEYRRAAICAAELDGWTRAAPFFEEGAKRTRRIEKNTETHIGLYADAGFAWFMAGNYFDSIRLLKLAMHDFEKVPQDNCDVKYFTLKKRLAYSIGWIAKHERDYRNSEPEEPRVGLCSNPETDERILNLPDSPIENIWLYLAQVEYRFGSGRTVLDYALQILDRDAYPALSHSISFLEAQHDFRNKAFDTLPERIYQLVRAHASVQKYNHSKKEIDERGSYAISIADLTTISSVESIVVVLATALLVGLRTVKDMDDILAIWRAKSLKLPIKENMFGALDLIESILSENQINALALMESRDTKHEKKFTAAIKIVHSDETGPKNLFNAHAFIAFSLIGNTLEDLVLDGLAELLSAQWLEKIKSPAVLQTPRFTVPQIENACTANETGKKKIGQILLAAQQAVSIKVLPETLGQFRSWAESESEQKPDAKTARNPIAQRLIRAMEKPPHLTHDDVEALRQSIEEGKIPVKFDSPFELDESENQ